MKKNKEVRKKAVKKNKEVRKYLDDYLKRKEINNLTKKNP